MHGRTLPHQPCRGPVRRREILRLGLAGLAGLTWPGLLRLRAEPRPNRPRARTALLVVWLHGGASHLETYDPKPLAPSEYRGPYRPIASRVPGLQLSELLPQHARVAHRFRVSPRTGAGLYLPCRGAVSRGSHTWQVREDVGTPVGSSDTSARSRGSKA